MHLTLLESDRSFLRSAECAAVSIVAHAGMVWFAIAATTGGRQLPVDEREARVFFLLPSDRVDAPLRQATIPRWPLLGGDHFDGSRLSPEGDAGPVRTHAYGARRRGERTGKPGALPLGPELTFVPDSIYSVLEVDQMVERFDGSDAPIYPPELSAAGREGQVRAVYVVDTTGRVDTTSIQVVESDDPRFTASVRTALSGMRFRPAKRAGKIVRQLVAQRFRFRIAPSPEHVPQAS